MMAAAIDGHWPGSYLNREGAWGFDTGFDTATFKESSGHGGGNQARATYSDDDSWATRS
jgi:hypothetical protein